MVFKNPIILKCNRCGYKKTVPNLDLVLPKICPKCKNILEVEVLDEDNFFKKILKILKW